MITIGTAKFDFKTDRESFAYALNGRWDTFFHTSFESVVEEVLSAYDLQDCVITINHLPLDLGRIDEESFDKQFPLRLREALEAYCKENLGMQPETGTTGKEVTIVSTGRSAFELLSFFLLHGSFPFTAEEKDTDLSLLLKKVIAEEAHRFRDFLNSYGHYDFLCSRLVFQFTDEELERIVSVVQPSESKFINLYVRVQIHAYSSMRRSDVTRNDYRSAVWTLVLAFLFSEGGGYFNRKQLVLHTIRGLAAHFNIALAEMVRMLTESIRELEQTVTQLPELWSILKEIRQNMKADFGMFDGTHHAFFIREILSALRWKEKEGTAYELSREHLIGVLSEQGSCRRLLGQLQEKEIYFLVGIIVPQEKEYVISYARMLDKHKDNRTFSGKAGSEFRLLKWEFIFAVLIALPASMFNRRQFVLAVLQRLAAHYNLSVVELVHLLCEDEALVTALSPDLWSALHELDLLLFRQEKKNTAPEVHSIQKWLSFLQTPQLARKFIGRHAEYQIISLVRRLLPAHSEFIINYAALLDKGVETGMLAGKAGGEFTTLKWEFIFSCLFSDSSVVFHQKIFVYSVLKQLAAHYNQNVVELVGYFLRNLSELLPGLVLGGLKAILKELYDESVLPLTDVGVVRSKSDAELEHWIQDLFGKDSTLFFLRKEDYLRKWLTYLLNERNGLLRSLWKAGKLDETFLLQVVNGTPSLRNLWLNKIGDERLSVIYRDFRNAYKKLRSRLVKSGYWEQLGEYLTIWMVELTASKFAAWSETEILRFLAEHIRQSIPPGLTILLEDIPVNGGNRVTEIIHHIDKLNEKGTIMEQIQVRNGGVVMLNNFLPMLFRRAEYLSSDYKSFKDENSKMRAIFILQYLVYGKQGEYPEHELFLNKLLVNWDSNKPLPRTCNLTENEMKIADSLVDSVRQMWNKLSHTSNEALRCSFFQREAFITKKEEGETIVWNIKVEEKAFDILLDTLPWSFGLVKYPWTDYMLKVNWRK